MKRINTPNVKLNPDEEREREGKQNDIYLFIINKKKRKKTTTTTTKPHPNNIKYRILINQ